MQIDSVPVQANTTLQPYRWGTFQAWMTLLTASLVIVAAYNYSPWRRIAAYLAVIGLSFMWYGLLHKRTYGLVLFYFWTVVSGGRLAWSVGYTLTSRHLSLIELLKVPLIHYEILILIGWWIIPAVLYYPKRWKEFS